ncbi:hypothetical protein DL96DRAFT_242673 [Flagelloscypha sp. PMI_526]|nr:hypothetical protein DL96DRAFT_242673 [Flagelloscypha sp. PMI_526]
MPANNQTLSRGLACTSCRHKKLRCDGEHPCHHCSRLKREDDCEYVEKGGTSMASQLEEQIKNMEARLMELQVKNSNPVGHSSQPVYLKDPYPRPSATRPAAKVDDDVDLPLKLKDQLVNAVLAHSRDVLFFLNHNRFKQRLAKGDVAQYLIASVHLCGSMLLGLSQETQAALLAKVRLGRAHIHGNQGRTMVTQRMQGEILLIQYLLTQNKFTDASYHSTAAMGVSLISRVHKLGTPTEAQLEMDDIEWKEHVMAFWSNIQSDYLIAMLMGTNSNLNEDSDMFSDLYMTTPWPDTKRGGKKCDRGPIDLFEDGEESFTPEESWENWEAKAGLLLYFSYRLTMVDFEHASEFTVEEIAFAISSIEFHAAQASDLLKVVPQLPITSSIYLRIRGHVSPLFFLKKSPTPVSIWRCFYDAVSVFRLTAEIPDDVTFVPVWIGVAWLWAAEVVVEKIGKGVIGLEAGETSPELSVRGKDDTEVELGQSVEVVRRGFERMKGCFDKYPLISKYGKMITETFVGTAKKEPVEDLPTQVLPAV